MKRVFEVRLHERPAAHIEVDERGYSSLAFLRSWLDEPRRPVLSQAFLDTDLDAPIEPPNGLHTWFLNLLPHRSSPMRRLIASHAGIAASDDLAYLDFVGRGLPGAVIVEELERESAPAPFRSHRARLDDGRRLRVRHSVPGLQTKVSILGSPRWNCPFHGLGGDWYLKIPAQDEPDLVVAEALALETARRAGFVVPEIHVIRTDEVERLHEIFDFAPRPALAVRRFDRPEAAPAVHFEDFAQIFDTHPDNLYGDLGRRDGRPEFDLVQIARTVHGLCGAADAATFVKRVVFDAWIGNTDGHLKNWSLLYPDRYEARLAPVYDVVPMGIRAEYGPVDHFALPFMGELGFAHLGETSLRRFIEACGLAVDEVFDQCIAFARNLQPEFERAAQSLGAHPSMLSRIASHRREVPLFKSWSASD